LIGALKVDWYLVSDDFGSYLDANKLVDEAYKDQDSWAEKYHPLARRHSDSRSILTVASMGFFSSDRAIQTYCDEIWYAHFKVLLLTSGIPNLL
jgi:starch phosphorylase